jgi:RNA polymerase sigma factor (sigma-70 family)
MNDDLKLLREYATGHSEAAFERIVERHLGLVYSAARRQAHDPFLAEEITQAVFLILARKAGSLSQRTILPGWLYRTTRFTASNVMRQEASRRQHEHEARMQSAMENDTPQVIWQEVRPLLDEAMSRLGKSDRDALVLRFFENKSLKEVGEALGVAERAAQKRVNRSLEKLRAAFARRGVTLSAAAMAGTLSANALEAAPVHLMPAVLSVSLGQSGVPAPLLWLVDHPWRRLFWRPSALALAGGFGVVLAVISLTAFDRSPTAARRGARQVGFVLPVRPGAALVSPAHGPAGIKLDLQGAPGVPFEVTRVENGISQTINGVLPRQISFADADYVLTIKVQGPGEFGFTISRDDQTVTTIPVRPIPHSMRYTINGKQGGQGIRLHSSNI